MPPMLGTMSCGDANDAADDADANADGCDSCGATMSGDGGGRDVHVWRQEESSSIYSYAYILTCTGNG